MASLSFYHEYAVVFSFRNPRLKELSDWRKYPAEVTGTVRLFFDAQYCL